MKYLYLYINIGSILIPLLFSFHPKIRFYKEWRYVLPAIVLSGLVYLSWDVLFTKNGYWGFNPLYITGFKILDLPIEEILFFISIPYASLFTHYCLIKFFPKLQLSLSLTKWVVAILVTILVSIAAVFYFKMYTMVNFVLTAIILLVSLLFSVKLLSRFLPTYVFVLLPFFLVNGILTGSFINEEVVWYNDMHNLGVRIGTIPIEDIFYGLGMLLLAQLIIFLLKKRAFF